MKKYLVTDQGPHFKNMAYHVGALGLIYEELPSDAIVVTREQVEQLITFYTMPNTRKNVLDVIFGAPK